MALKLYNQTAYNYEANSDLLSDNEKPFGYESWHCNLKTQRWLTTEIYEFSFPPSGLQGIHKDIVVRKLNELIHLQSTNLQISSQLVSLSQFIARNEIIFNN